MAERAATADGAEDAGNCGASASSVGGGNTVGTRAEVNVELRTYCYMGFAVDGSEVGRLTIQLFDVTPAGSQPHARRM